jgi:hypothetical protein
MLAEVTSVGGLCKYFRILPERTKWFQLVRSRQYSAVCGRRRRLQCDRFHLALGDVSSNHELPCSGTLKERPNAELVWP